MIINGLLQFLGLGWEYYIGRGVAIDILTKEKVTLGPRNKIYIYYRKNKYTGIWQRKKNKLSIPFYKTIKTRIPKKSHLIRVDKNGKILKRKQGPFI